MLKLLVLVCVCSACFCSDSQPLARAALNRDYGVKLCGREFIRAVIFTCGGSRWKREADDVGDSNPFDTSSYSERSDTDGELSWLKDMSAAVKHSSLKVSSLPDLLRALGEAHQYGGEAEAGWDLGNREPGPGWPRPSKAKRNFSLGVAGMCCHQGCTKNDIGRLC